VIREARFEELDQLEGQLGEDLAEGPKRGAAGLPVRTVVTGLASRKRLLGVRIRVVEEDVSPASRASAVSTSHREPGVALGSSLGSTQVILLATAPAADLLLVRLTRPGGADDRLVAPVQVEERLDV